MPFLPSGHWLDWPDYACARFRVCDNAWRSASEKVLEGEVCIGKSLVVLCSEA